MGVGAPSAPILGGWRNGRQTAPRRATALWSLSTDTSRGSPRLRHWHHGSNAIRPAREAAASRRGRTTSTRAARPTAAGEVRGESLGRSPDRAGPRSGWDRRRRGRRSARRGDASGRAGRPARGAAGRARGANAFGSSAGSIACPARSRVGLGSDRGAVAEVAGGQRARRASPSCAGCATAGATTTNQSPPASAAASGVSPRPVASAVPPREEERDVAAERRGEAGQVAGSSIGRAPEAASGEQGRGRVAAGAAETGGDRDALAQVDRRAGGDRRLSAEEGSSAAGRDCRRRPASGRRRSG